MVSRGTMSSPSCDERYNTVKSPRLSNGAKEALFLGELPVIDPVAANLSAMFAVCVLVKTGFNPRFFVHLLTTLQTYSERIRNARKRLAAELHLQRHAQLCTSLLEEKVCSGSQLVPTIASVEKVAPFLLGLLQETFIRRNATCVISNLKRDIVLLSRPAEMADKILSTQTKGITGNAGGREESTKSATENSAIGSEAVEFLKNREDQLERLTQQLKEVNGAGLKYQLEMGNVANGFFCGRLRCNELLLEWDQKRRLRRELQNRLWRYEHTVMPERCDVGQDLSFLNAADDPEDKICQKRVLSSLGQNQEELLSTKCYANATAEELSFLLGIFSADVTALAQKLTAKNVP